MDEGTHAPIHERPRTYVKMERRIDGYTEEGWKGRWKYREGNRRKEKETIRSWPPVDWGPTRSKLGQYKW